MQFVLAYLRLYRAHGLTFLVVLLFIGVSIVLMQLRPTEFGLAFLGDQTALRSTAQPQNNYSPAAARPIAAVLPTPALEADTLPDTEQKAALIAALDCARAQQEQTALTEDPALSQQAEAIWYELARQPGASLTDVAGARYAIVTVIPLTLHHEEEASTGACVFGGIDLAQLDLSWIGRVGVAVFPDPTPLDGLEDSSAVILGQ